MYDVTPFIQSNTLPFLYSIYIIGLALEPRSLRLFFTLTTLAPTLSIAIPAQRTGSFVDQYTLNCFLLASLFTYADWIILGNPDKERWHRQKIPSQNATNTSRPSSSFVDENPRGFFPRLWWAVRLAYGFRYVGWSCQISKLPAGVPRGYSKIYFLIRKALRAAILFLLWDTANAYFASTPYGGYQGEKSATDVIGFDQAPTITRFGLSLLLIVVAYTSIEMTNCVASVFLVAVRLADPEECPPMFGDLKHAYTVRNCWSKVWHGVFRRTFVTMGLFAARVVFRFRKGTFSSRYTQLFIGFICSTIIHGGGSMIVQKKLTDIGEFSFFMAQPLMILVEDHVIKFGQYLGIRDSPIWRVFGFVYTIAWFGFSLQTWTSGLSIAGAWVTPRGFDLLNLGPAPY